MAGLVALVEAAPDRRSWKDTADDLEDMFKRSGRDAGSGFSKELGSGLSDVQRIGRDAGSSFSTAIRGGMRDAISGITSEFGALGRVVEGGFRGMESTGSSVFSSIGTKGLAAASAITAIGATAVVVGKQLYDLGAQWDDIADGITLRTGQVGDGLKSLTDVVGDVGSNTAASLGDIGNIVGQLAQSMPDLAQNSSGIRDMASNLAYLNANGQAVNIRELGKAFNAFGVNAADQVKTLDDLNKVSQSTGIPINNLIQTVQAGAPQFKQFGLDVGQATGLVASFEEAGLDSGVSITGLRTALKNVGDDARGAAPALADAITKIKALHDAGNEGAAGSLAQSVFGTKNFAPFLDAIESGKLSVDSLNKSLEQSGMSIKDLQEATDDGAQGFEQLRNTVESKLGPAASNVFGFVNDLLLTATGNTKLLITAQDKLTDSLKQTAAVPITPDSALGKMLTPAGLADGATPGASRPGGIGGAAFGAGGGGGLVGPDGLLRPQWGSRTINAPPIKSPSAGSGAAGGDLTPYDATLPAGFANLPQTSSLYSAESGFLDARHTLAEKQAALNKLEGDNTATATQLQAARNDVMTAERSQTEAQLRLADAAQGSATKLQGAAEQLGAALDADLGISKGLPGLADNLVRFLANLAAAPALGRMAATSAANPNQGSGLIGQLASQGAFGPQYTPAGIAAAGGTSGSVAAGGGGYGGYGGVAAPGSSTTAPAGVAAPQGSVSSGGGGYGGSAAAVSAPLPGPAMSGAYGLPGGTNTGGYGSGGKGIFPDWVQKLGAAFGVTPSTYAGHQETDRHEAGYAPNPSHENRGIDWTGTPQAMQKFADYLKNVPGMEQVIWNGGGIGTGDTVEIAGGRSQPGYFAGDLAGHGNHVHTRQSSPIPLPGGGGGGGSAWGSGADTGVPSLLGGGAQGPANVPTAAPDPYAALPIMGGMGGGRMGGGGMPNGPVLGGAGPLVGAGASPSVGGSAAAGGGGFAGSAMSTGVPFPSQGGGGGGGIGITPGGSVDTAMNLAASALPGVGAAAQTGMKLANRAIQYAGQVAGIGVSGLMETFLPMGSEKASKGWATRLVGGLAGAKPALPNMAGGQQPPAPGGGLIGNGAAGPVDQSTQINVTNQRATEDGTGKDIAFHLGAQNQGTRW